MLKKVIVKTCGLLIAFAIMVGCLSMLGSYDVLAADFTDDPLVFDVEYSQMFSGQYYDKRYTTPWRAPLDYDAYKLIIPSAGVLTIDGYIDGYTLNDAGSTIKLF